MNEQPTPETEEAAWAETYVVKASFARRLECQRDELLEALTVIRTVASYPHHPNALHAIQSMAKNAIAAVKGGRNV